MIGYVQSSVESAVGIYLFKKIIGYFRSLARTIMFSGLYNSFSMYCFSILLNLLY